MDTAVSKKSAIRAALLYARGKWGKVVLGEPAQVFGIADDVCKAYVFPVGFHRGLTSPHELLEHVENRIRPFRDALEKLRRAHDGTRLPSGQHITRDQIELFKQCHRDLLDPEDYGTIVISGHYDRHPAIMAYDGIPFTLVGTGLVKANLDYKVPGTGLRYRMPDGSGYPHFFGEFLNARDETVLVSLLNGRNQYRVAAHRRPPPRH